MADSSDSQAANAQFMTTEHFTLATARSAAISEANGRSTLFLNAVSSAIVALAFIGQVSELGQAFYVFALVLFPSLYFLGLVTFVRVLQTSIEDMLYAREINRIRHYYLEQSPQLANYFILSSHDDSAGMNQNMGFISSKGQIYMTSASAIAVISSVIAGVFTSLLLMNLSKSQLPLTWTIVLGVSVFLVSVVILQRYQVTQWRRVERQLQIRFPSPVTSS